MGNFVNLHQTPDERRGKYNLAREAGLPVSLSRRVRDWSYPHLHNLIEIYNEGEIWNQQNGEKNARK